MKHFGMSTVLQALRLRNDFAIVNILGMLIGVGAIAKVARDGKGIGEVAKLQREMSPYAVAGLGGVFSKHTNELKTTMKFCKWSWEMPSG